MKRIAFCFDGTWNKIDGEHPTNVARIAQSVSRYDKEGRPQFIYYDEGVGTSATERWTGGILGRGLMENVIEAYHFLVLNYEPGDQLYVFGFSRGAFTARSFVGLVRNCGIISRRSLTHIRAAMKLYMNRADGASPNSERARQFRMEHCPMLCLPGDLKWRKETFPDKAQDDLTDLNIQFLGVWDTVGALGIPNHLSWLAKLFNRKYRFHDTTLSSFVSRACHAVSVDEQRRAFEPSMWTNLDDLNDRTTDRYEQVLFPGVHAAVGGGGPVRGLSDAALEWIFKAARKQGLAFDLDDQSPIYSLKPDHRAQLFNATGKVNWSFGDFAMGVGLRARRFPEMDRRSLHPSLARRFRAPADQLPEGQLYRPPSVEGFWEVLGDIAERDAADIAAERVVAADPRALRTPSRARKYIIKPGDTLESIAAKQMPTGGDSVLVLKLHNRNLGLLFETEDIYAGSELEIPEYDPPVEVMASEPATPPSAGSS